MSTIVIASGYFDPLHVGHIEYLKKAAALGNRLIVIINNDEQAYQKKGRCFIPAIDRSEIVQALKSVDCTFISFDTDRTVCKTLATVAKPYLEAGMEVIFAKGGDRTSEEIPEGPTCEELGIKIVDGLGPKIRSSSKLVEEIQHARCR